MTDPRTLMVVLAHPDDEVLVAGSILAQKARGDQVVVVWLTHGEMTEAFGPLEPEAVAGRRAELAGRAAEMLGVEHRILHLPDTGVVADRESATLVARLIAEYEPDGLVTWGDAWVKGMRHPDHQATGKIARDAVTLARIAKVVAPATPHRGNLPVFTIRGVHSTLPWVAVDVSPWLDGILALAEHYRRALGFGDPHWLRARLSSAGALAGLEWAEVFETWEGEPGTTRALLPAGSGPTLVAHPDRDRGEDG